MRRKCILVVLRWRAHLWPIGKNCGEEMNSKRNFWSLAAALATVFVVIAGVAPAAAQVPTTTVNGIVTDPQSAAIGGAKIAATNRATGVVRETLSNADGLYAIPDLPAGSYVIRIAASGFVEREFADMQLEAGRTSTLDAKLELA